ncbi:hypothetical protein ACHAWF_003486 [Thalassiosira exigua]
MPKKKSKSKRPTAPKRGEGQRQQQQQTCDWGITPNNDGSPGFSNGDDPEDASFQNRERMDREWRALLDDPNSTKELRDFALSQLNDPVGLGKIFDGKPEVKYDGEGIGRGDWTLIEDFEEGNWGSDSGNAIIGAAADIILTKEGYDNGSILLSARGMRPGGRFNFLEAYPKLCEACLRVTVDPVVDRELKSNAHVVLGFLRGQTSLEAVGGEAMDDVKKALQLSPEDWRVHGMLATRNMAVYNTALALEGIERALDLATDDLARLSLGIRRGKILHNLHGREDDMIAAFEESLSLYENGVKDHPRMNDLLVGRLAVAEYMLVIGYDRRGEHKKALNHYREAEAKRGSIDEETAKSTDWTSRMVAQLIVANTSPGNVKYGECHHCGKTAASPQRCGACRAVFYCSKGCQVQAWKGGHKKECKKLKADRKEKKAAAREEANERDHRSGLPPLDANLNPKKLWDEGVELSKSGNYEDAVWNFALALFMSAALDANDKQPVKDAVENCSEDDALAMALSVICAPRGNILRRSNEVYKKAIRMNITAVNIEMGESTADVDRNVFGVGMCLIMHARMLGRSYSMDTLAKANSRTHRDAFDDVARLVRNANTYIDSQRWLTLQFELGYSSMDVGAVNEAEKWLKQFVSSVDETASLRSDRGAQQHWSDMKASAETRLAQLPLLKTFDRNNPGFGSGDDCIVM